MVCSAVSSFRAGDIHQMAATTIFHHHGRRQARRKRFLQSYRPLSLEALEARLALAILTVNSLADGPANFADATVTLRDAIEAANNDVAVSPGGPSGSGSGHAGPSCALGSPARQSDDAGLGAMLALVGLGLYRRRRG